MARAMFNGTVVAESDDVEIVEGNVYFPVDSLDRSVVSDSDHESVCPWKGTASYWNVTVDGETADNAAWYYPEAKKGAEAVVGRVAFYPVVTVEQ